MKKQWILCLAALLSLTMIAGGCSAGLGKIPTVEAETLEEAETGEEEAAPEETAAEDTGWKALTWADVPEFHEADVFVQEEDQEEEEWIDEVNTPNGLGYRFSPTYLYETAGGMTIGAEPLNDAASELAEPSDAEISYGQAVDLAAESVEALFGQKASGGWGVQYYPANTAKQEAYYGGRAEYEVWSHVNAIGYVYLDAITGEWLEIAPYQETLSGETVIKLILWGEAEGLDTSALDAYLEEGRKFAVEGGPEMLAKAAAENLGLAVSEVTLEPINIRVRADGDPTYLEYIKESVASGETDAYLYNDGIVRVKAKTAGGEICFEIDTVSRTVKQITRGTHLDEENWIVVEAE